MNGLLLTLVLLVLFVQYIQSEDSSPSLCTNKDDCKSSKSECIGGHCTDPMLFPLNMFDIIGTVGAFIACAIAAGGGLGGGGLLVPLYIIMLEMNPHEAIPLSKATIFGNAVASLIMNTKESHPVVRDRPLIDFECMLLMEPMTLAGTILGVNLNTVLPEWLITLMLVLLLAKTAQRTYRKGHKVYQKELKRDEEIVKKMTSYWKLLPMFSKNKSMEHAFTCLQKWKKYKRLDATSEVSVEMEMVPLHSDDLKGEDVVVEENGYLVKQGAKSSDQQSGITLTLEDMKKYKRSIPWFDLSILLIVWMALILFSFVKGGHGSPSIVGIQCGSVSYWFLYVVAVPFFIVVTYYFGKKIIQRHRVMQSSGYKYAEGDMIWNMPALIKYPGLCMFAGVAAGLLGIGGGMVKGPLLLEMGLIPQVSAATSGTMILFTSSATTFQYIALGTLSFDYACWYGVVGFIAGISGHLVLGYFIRKYRKAAFVIFLISIVIGLSGLVMGTVGLADMINNGFGEFQSLCKRKS